MEKHRTLKNNHNQKHATKKNQQLKNNYKQKQQQLETKRNNQNKLKKHSLGRPHLLFSASLYRNSMKYVHNPPMFHLNFSNSPTFPLKCLQSPTSFPFISIIRTTVHLHVPSSPLITPSFLSTPSGWTPILEQYRGYNNIYGHIYWKM